MLKSALSSRARLPIGVLVVAAFAVLPVLADSPNRPTAAPVTAAPVSAARVVGEPVADHASVAAAAPAALAPASETPRAMPHRVIKPAKRAVRRAKPHKRIARKAKPHKRIARKAKPHKRIARKAKPHKRIARKAKPRRAARRPVYRNGSNTVTVGHYIRSLRGVRRDYYAMRTLGAQDASRNPAHGRYLVLLDIGGQTRSGVRLSTTMRTVSYAALADAMRGYVVGYHQKQRADAPVTIAIGTNNDLWVGTSAGRIWATQVVNPVAVRARRYAGMVIAGANDIEPGFAGSPQQTRAWFKGYRAYTRAPFVFNGSADGCSWVRPNSRCNGGWTSRDIVGLAGLIEPGRTTVVPQIYNHAMAGQWLQLAREARSAHGRLNIVGPLTENRACGRDPYCPTMPTRAAWNALWTSLHRARLAARPLPISVDLDVS